jgi:hypothetical protein
MRNAILIVVQCGVQVVVILRCGCRTGTSFGSTGRTVKLKPAAVEDSVHCRITAEGV